MEPSRFITSAYLLAARPEGLLPLPPEPLVHVDALGVRKVAVCFENVQEFGPWRLRAPAGARLGAREVIKRVVYFQGIEVRGVVGELARGGRERIEVVRLGRGGVPVFVAAARAADEEARGRQGGQEVEGLAMVWGVCV